MALLDRIKAAIPEAAKSAAKSALTSLLPTPIQPIVRSGLLSRITAATPEDVSKAVSAVGRVPVPVPSGETIARSFLPEPIRTVAGMVAPVKKPITTIPARKIPETIVQSTGGALFRGLARGALEFAPQTAEARAKGEPSPTLTPITPEAKFLIGEEPLRPISEGPIASRISEPLKRFSERLGAEPSTAQKISALPLVALSAFVDNPFLAGAGAQAKTGQKLIGKIAESKAAEEILPHLRTIFKNVGDEVLSPLAQRLKDIPDPAAVKQELTTFAKETVPAVRPTERALAPAAEIPPAKAPPPSEVPGIPEGMRERGFITSVKEAPQVPAESKAALEQLPPSQRVYEPYTDAAAVSKAQERITKNPDEALTSVLSSDKVDKETITTGLELMRKYREAGDVAMEARIAGNLAEKGTTSGQTIQAFSILNKLSPDGILVLAAQRLGEAPSEPLARKLIEQAKEIEQLPFGYKKNQKTQDMIETISREAPAKPGEKALQWVEELSNLPRSLASSFDLSAGLRQGLVALSRHPKEWLRAFGGQLKAFASEKGYATIMDSVMKNPDFGVAQESGLSLTDLGTRLNGREEKYMSNWAEKIPGLGRGIRASSRAYTAFLNKLRMDSFSSLLKSADDAGLNPKGNEVLSKQLASLVNDITGRGSLPRSLERAAPLLNAFFFSPRLIASRLNLLAPVKYVAADPFVRKEYLKTMLSFSTMVGTVLGLASLHDDVTVGTDPRSADFGKIKVGNTRFDVAGGFQQYVRIGAQLISGKYVNSSTGKIITLGEGYRPLTRKEILFRGIESKEAPIFSFLSAWLAGQDAEGNKLNVPKEIGERFKPMVLRDLYELSEDDPALLPFGLLGILGIGVQTYAPPEAYQKLNEINKSPDPAKAFADLQESNPTLAQKVRDAKLQETFNEFDWGLTYMGVENGERAKFLYEYMRELPPEQSGALWDDLQSKKLLSDRVAEQLIFLIKNPPAK